MPQNIKKYALTAAKLVVILLLFIFVISLADTGKVSSTEFSVMSEKVLLSADLSAMKEGDNQLLRRLYGLEPSSVEGVLLYYPADSMDANELLLVKLKDMSMQTAVKDAMQARIDSQIAVFESYAPESTAMLKKGVIRVEGNYLLLIVAEDPQPVVQAFLSGL